MGKLSHALAIAICVVGLATGPASGGTTFERIKEQGLVRIGLNNQHPFSFKEADGSLSGFAYETVRAAFSKIGVHQIEPLVIDWASMIPALKAERIDVIVAGMFIRPARCEQVAFSNPDYQAFDTLVVLKGNPMSIHSYDDVRRNPKIKVAAIQGGATAMTLRNVGLPEQQQVILPGYVEMFAALQSGRVQAVAIDSVSAGKFLAADKERIERAEPFEIPIIDGKPALSYGGYVFRKGDEDLVKFFNTFLDDFVGSAEQIAILGKYELGANDVPLQDVTSAQLCKQ